MLPPPQTHRYARRPTGDLLLDLYMPDAGAKGLVLFAYGGGFTKGARDSHHHQGILAMLLDAGYAAVVPDYRLKTTPEDLSPEHLRQARHAARRARMEGITMARRLYGHRLLTACEDLSEALTFCRQMAPAWNVPGRKIGMIGVSAGGLAGNALCYPPGLWRDRLNKPDAMIALAAPVPHPWRLSRKGPAVWILHGQRDRIIPCADAELTQRMAAEAGAPVRVYMPADATHMGIQDTALSGVDADGQRYRDAMLRFLDTHIGG